MLNKRGHVLLCLNFCAALFVFSACNQKKDSLSEQTFPLYRLLGQWKLISKKADVIEEWQSTDSVHFSAWTYVPEQGDTCVIERLRLFKGPQDSLLLQLYLPDQEKAFIRFELLRQSNQEMIFENLSPHYPSLIGYRLISSVEMMIFTEGILGGEQQHNDFYYLRVDSTRQHIPEI